MDEKELVAIIDALELENVNDFDAFGTMPVIHGLLEDEVA